MNIKQKLGKKIREIRKNRNLTQENVAEFTDITPESYCRIESGLSYPKPENIEKICEILKVEIFELFDFDHHDDVETLKNKLFEILKDEKNVRFLYKVAKSFDLK